MVATSNSPVLPPRPDAASKGTPDGGPTDAIAVTYHAGVVDNLTDVVQWVVATADA